MILDEPSHPGASQDQGSRRQVVALKDPGTEPAPII